MKLTPFAYPYGTIAFLSIAFLIPSDAFARYQPTPQLVRQVETLETKFEKLLRKTPGFAETYAEKASVLAKKTTNEKKRYILDSLRHTAEAVAFEERDNRPVRAEGATAMPFVASIYLDGMGKEATTLAEMERMRKDLESIDPHARATWALSDKFVFDEGNRPQLQKVFEYVEKYGDEIGIGYGFANNQLDLEGWKKKMAEWMYMYRYNALNELHDSRGADDPVGTFRSIPHKYRPTSVTTYAINHEQADWVRANFDIDAFFGWTATQYHVDQLSGEGSPLMPYWSRYDHPMVPAQSRAESSGNLFLNTITVDPVGCSHTEGESRWTIHPADPVTDGASQLHTVGQYLSNPYRSKNTSGYLSLFIDINWMLRDVKLESGWKNIVANWPKDGNVSVQGIRQFAWEYERTAGKTNQRSEFTLLFRWSGIVRDKWTSEKDVRMLWTETQSERIILKRRDTESEWSIVDFTDYSASVTPLRYTTKWNEEDVSFVTGRNFKISPLAPLKDSEKERVRKRLESIGWTEPVRYE